MCHHFITEGLGEGISVVKGVIPYDAFVVALVSVGVSVGELGGCCEGPHREGVVEWALSDEVCCCWHGDLSRREFAVTKSPASSLVVCP